MGVLAPGTSSRVTKTSGTGGALVAWGRAGSDIGDSSREPVAASTVCFIWQPLTLLRVHTVFAVDVLVASRTVLGFQSEIVSPTSSL